MCLVFSIYLEISNPVDIDLEQPGPSATTMSQEELPVLPGNVMLQLFLMET